MIVDTIFLHLYSNAIIISKYQTLSQRTAVCTVGTFSFRSALIGRLTPQGGRKRHCVTRSGRRFITTRISDIAP